MRHSAPLALVVLAVALVVAAVTARAHPKHEGRLEGTWFIGSEIVEGGVGPENTHFYLWIEGKAAEALYSELDVPVEHDACADAPVKWLGKIKCLDLPEGFRCYFAVDLQAQRIAVGSSC
jgi:hypothetical protein